MISQASNKARAEEARIIGQMVLELVNVAGIDGIKASTIASRLGISFGTNRHALLRLEKAGLIERTRRKGKNLYWGPPGVKAHKKLAAMSHDPNYAAAKREARALVKLGDDADLLPMRRVIVSANQAEPIEKLGVSSVWELAS